MGTINNLPKKVLVSGYILIFLGIFALMAGILFVPDPDVGVEYVTDYNGSYAEEQQEESIFMFTIKEPNASEINPTDVHTIVNKSEISSNTTDKLRNIVGTNKTVRIDSNSIYPERFMTNINGTLQVYEGNPKQITGINVAFIGIGMVFLGYIFVYRMRENVYDTPDGVIRKDEGKWKFYVVDDEEENSSDQ